MIQSLCVFCGSSTGRDERYAGAARDLGQLLAAEGIRLVYGGGRVGLMGVVADAVLAAGGTVTGVIPRPLWAREVGHTGLSELHIVETMHERKARMVELSDGFVALPGGMGTLDELFEVWTWAQLGIHAKPFGVVNVGGYFDALLAFLDHTTGEQFVLPQHRAMLMAHPTPALLLELLRAWKPPAVRSWLDLDRT
ncbi:MAG: TIGR00730 family Rossman fold protein [Gemmatimonadetes bacterium]|nr:TIGR00730 family Rossman fold protein [Gemmatimonadota bacterium]